MYVEAKLDESVAFRNQDGQDEKAEVQEESRPGSSETKIDIKNEGNHNGGDY